MSLNPDWAKHYDPRCRNHYYFNETTGQTQWEIPNGWLDAVSVTPPPPPLPVSKQLQQVQEQLEQVREQLRQREQQHQRNQDSLRVQRKEQRDKQRLQQIKELREQLQLLRKRPKLSQMVYKFCDGSGVDPKFCFNRVAANEILAKIPRHFDDLKNHCGLGVVLHGPPGSGKSSMLGVIDQELRKLYGGSGENVLFVRGSNCQAEREETYRALLDVPQCVVLLDDAEAWFGHDEFWALFRCKPRIFVAATTVSFQHFLETTPFRFHDPLEFSAALRPTELTRLLNHNEIDEEYHEQLEEWFGNHFGRIDGMAPKLWELFCNEEERFQRLDYSANTPWGYYTGTNHSSIGMAYSGIIPGVKKDRPKVSLEEVFFRAKTLEQLSSQSFLPAFDDEMRATMTRVWAGETNAADIQKLERRGILNKDGTWSCEYMRQKHFRDLFHVHARRGYHRTFRFHDAKISSAPELVAKGFAAIRWSSVKQTADASNCGFPTEDIWRAHFYAGIGHFIPNELATLCHEQVTHTRNQVDFVLANKKRVGIKFHVRPVKAEKQHEKFEKGEYSKLELGEYIVVDILPWDHESEPLGANQELELSLATERFQCLEEHRRRSHAVFLVSRQLDAGVLYAYRSSEVRKIAECHKP
jgi:hypothetical protein